MIFVYVGLIANRLPRTSPPPNDLEKVLFYLSIALLNIVFILLFYSLSIRRLHDLDKTGWWVLLSGIPMVNVGMFIWLLLAKGREKVNRYGKPDSARIVPALFNLTYRNER